MEVDMFGITAFSEAAFSEVKVSESVFLGTLPIIYFNNSTLTFPLKINEISNFDLTINKLQEHQLSINTVINFNEER
tara:strand:+ start:179 stop:409 length:231 start_codon:yes stop_codon:yes gene_type:complete